MKTLVIGAGSMGQRRLRDLTYLSPGEVALFEPDTRRCREAADRFAVSGFTQIEAALAERPEALCICTPPALHEQYVRLAMERCLHVFSELPFVLDFRALNDVALLAPTFPRILGVSSTIRYYPPFRLIHDLINSGAIGIPLYLEYSLGNYLPDWHPHEDYRSFYASDARLGGAGMDMILHEISSIQWWLGPIESASGRLTKLSSLEINGPDNHDALLTFCNGCRGYFHHDIIERGTVGRHIRIAGERGTLEWHQNQAFIRVHDGPAGREIQHAVSAASDWDSAMSASREVTEIIAKNRNSSGQVPSGQTGSFTYESCYLREMRHFLDAAQGRLPYTLSSVEEELQTVRVFHAILRSSDRHSEFQVGDIR